MGCAQVGVHDDFFQLGGHSLLALRLIAKVEDVLGFKLPISSMLRANTVERMAMLVARRRASSGDPTRDHDEPSDDRVVTLQPFGDEPPVFMLPGMGGHVISLRELALAMGTERPIYGLQPTLHNLDVLPYPSLEELASELIKDMKRVWNSGPYHLLGFSAGGTIAFEIARQLRDAGEPVGLLGLLDSKGPGYARLLPLHIRLVRHFRMIRRLESRERFQYAIGRGRAILRRFRRAPSSSRGRMNGSLVQPTPNGPIAGHVWHDVHHRHRFKAYGGEVNLFAANKPDWLGTDFSDPTMGWASVVRGGVKLHRIPGHHVEIVKLPWANDLAVKIRNCLDAL